MRVVWEIEERFFDCVAGRPARAGRETKRPATPLRMTFRGFGMAESGGAFDFVVFQDKQDDDSW